MRKEGSGSYFSQGSVSCLHEPRTEDKSHKMLPAALSKGTPMGRDEYDGSQAFGTDEMELCAVV